MTEFSEARAKALFEQFNLVAAGHRSDETIVALSDFLAAAICISVTSLADAEAVCDGCASDIKATVRKRFEWYRSPSGHIAVGREGKA